MPNESYQTLQAAILQLLAAAGERAQILDAITKIHTLFSTITGIRGDVSDPVFDRESWLQHGLAVSPHLAAKCLVEVYRTVQFLRGVYAGIQAALQRFPQQPIHILYPGCGPYATLIMPFTTLFTPEQIQVTLVDIHQQSIVAVQRLIHTLGVAAHFHDCIQADAATYQHPTSLPLHLIILEIMQGGLEWEPQVAITLHLLPQLSQNGLIIPQNIAVDTCLTSSEKENFGTLVRWDKDRFPIDHSQLEKERVLLGRILELNVEAGSALRPYLGRESAVLPPTTITIPPHPPDKDQFMLLTSIDVFGSIRIHNYQSEVSHPIILNDLNGVKVGEAITFSYTLSQKPGFKYQVAPAPAEDGTLYAA